MPCFRKGYCIPADEYLCIGPERVVVVGVHDSRTYFSRIAKEILGSDYESFVRFFVRLFSSCLELERAGANKYFFVAFLTRRCHVLFEIFSEILFLFDDHPLLRSYGITAKRAKSIIEEHFITDNNLVAQAGKIADIYSEFEVFPEVIIADEIILHGRAVNSLLLQYERAVMGRLSCKPEMSESRRSIAMECLVNSIQLRIYAQNDEPLLLLSRYRHQLVCDRLCNPIQVRELSKKFASLVNNSNVNNVTYSWNFKIPSYHASKWEYLPPPPHFTQVRTHQKRIYQTCYLWAYPNPRRPKAVCTIRWRRLSAASGELRDLMVIPFIIFDHVPRENLVRLHRRLCQDLRELKNASDFLTSCDLYAVGPCEEHYLCWISETNDLMLTYLLLKRFAGNSLSLLTKNLQTALLARNFKRISRKGADHQQIVNALKEIWSWEPPCQDQLEQYFDILLEGAQPLWTSEELECIPNCVTVGNTPEDRLLTRAVEDTIAAIGYEAEQNACEKYSSGIFFSDQTLADWGRRYSCAEALSICARFWEKAETGKPLNRYGTLGLIVQHMDLGIIGMNPYHTGPSDTLYTMVRAGEHSLFIKPTRYQDYIPVLIAIDKRCHDSQLNLRRELERFISCLPAAMLDVTVDELYGFMRSLKRANQKIKDWDFLLFDQISLQDRRHESRALEYLSKSFAKQVFLLQEYRKI